MICEKILSNTSQYTEKDTSFILNEINRRKNGFSNLYQQNLIIRLHNHIWTVNKFNRNQRFFLYVKMKPLRETIFCRFFHFFHARKWFSRMVCFNFFTEGNGFHAHFQIFFSRIAKNFSRTENREFSRKVYYFHARVFFFGISNL